MLERFFKKPETLARLQGSPLAEDLAALGPYLEARGYRIGAIRGYMRAAAHQICCFDAGLITLKGITEQRLKNFVKRHSVECSCPPPNYCGQNFISVARHLFAVLCKRLDIAPPPAPETPETAVNILMTSFDAHLRDVRGLRESTRQRCILHAERFLNDLGVDDRLDLERVSVEAVRQQVAARAAANSPNTARGFATAVRALFRFLAMTEARAEQLLAAVPTVKTTRQAGLPRGLSEEQLSQLLTSIDEAKPIGLRAKAIVLSLATLGLRAGEVAGILFDDLDWRKGTITLNTSKSRRADVMPLPTDVGGAIVAYLERGRPATADRHLFVRHYYPVGQELTARNVSDTVSRALLRSGLQVPRLGAHLLRHTAASRLVRAGVGIKDVADFMRHRSIDTTRIYVRVDWEFLAEIALPWPEEVSS